MTDAELLAAIRNGDKDALGYAYTCYREKCIAFANKHLVQKYRGGGRGVQESVDLYQDAILIFYKNIQNGNLIELKATISTYLIAVMRNIWSKKQTKTTLPLLVNITEEEEEHLDILRQRLRRALAKIDKKCRTIIVLKHFDGLTMKEVAELTHFKNGDTVRNIISRCRKKLKLLFKKEPELPYQTEVYEDMALLDGLTEEE